MPIRRRGTQHRRQPARRTELPERRHESFETLVERALDGLPAEFARLLKNVAIVIEDEPVSEPGLYGLYEGVPAVEYAADWMPFPNKISLFRLPLEEDFPDPDELADEVRRTVIHELAHHVGVADDNLPREYR
jgi:predicted Zn-dependent protease with MMP-like domain